MRLRTSLPLQIRPDCAATAEPLSNLMLMEREQPATAFSVFVHVIFFFFNLMDNAMLNNEIEYGVAFSNMQSLSCASANRSFPAILTLILQY